MSVRVIGGIGCVGIFVGISSFLAMSNFSKNNLLGLLFEFCHLIVYNRLEGLLFLLKLPLLASSVISESLFASTKFVAIFVATWDSLRWQHFKVATFGR